MADQWITTTYVDNLLGSKVRVSLFTDGATYKTAAFNGTAQAATALVKEYVRSAGYTPPGATTTYGYLKLAVLGEFVKIAYSRKDKNLKFPEDWADSAWMQALKAIASGEAELDLPQSTVSGHGGILFTSHGDDDSPPIFNRSDLDYD